MSIANPDVEATGTYIDTNTKILHHCLRHDEYWETTPSRALSGVGCPKCKLERFLEKRLRTNDCFVDALHDTMPYIIPVEEYHDCKTKILVRCEKHNIEWRTTPDSLLRGHGCPGCLKERIGAKNSKSFEQYIGELKETNPNVICIGEYKNATTHVRHRCLDCGHEWDVPPSQVLGGRGCPKCRTSKGEKAISKWLTSHNIQFETQKKFDDCKDKKPLPFDFYLPNNNIAIEYDGYQHFHPIDFWGGDKQFAERVRHDKIKDQYCKDNNISLIRISYDKNVDQELNNLFT